MERKGKLSLLSKKLELDIFKLNVEENIEKVEQDQFLQQVNEFLQTIYKEFKLHKLEFRWHFKLKKVKLSHHGGNF